MNMRDMQAALSHIIEGQRLSVLFQPILSLEQNRIFGYEALIRGPSDSPLHAPLALLRAAEHLGQSSTLEKYCFEAALKGFTELKLTGKLFVNLRPMRLLEPFFQPALIDTMLHQVNIDPKRVVLEITESDPILVYETLHEAVCRLRAQGLGVAIDDLGEGFSSLRLWSEIKPSYVKIDKHFISGLNHDPVKLQFVRSIKEIALQSNALTIAEGVETESELALIRDLGIDMAQGFFIGRPAPIPSALPSPEAMRSLEATVIPVRPGYTGKRTRNNAAKLLVPAPVVEPHTQSEKVLDLMLENKDLHALAVVDEGVPVGLITRPALLERFTRIYTRELYGKKPCSSLMDDDPLVVDINTVICDLSEMVVRKGKQAFTDGFIITDRGRYCGLGSGYDLMREVTDLQVIAARYANPLTLLPGNVPIHEHTDRLLEAKVNFVAAYCDLDHFKPFNDVYGYRRGDEIIQLLARLLTEAFDANVDFIGHIGGDDFFLLCQSPDWEPRCRQVLAKFEQEREGFFTPEHRVQNGFYSEDRRGNMTFHPLVSLSIGVVVSEQFQFTQHQEVERAAADAKKLAKKIDGNSLFIERRRYALPIQTGMP